MDKNTCRKNVLAIRGILKENEVLNLSNQVMSRLDTIKEYVESEEILFYVSYNNEISTIQLIENAFMLHKKVAVPKVVDEGVMEFFYINSLNDLKKGYMGILEPTSSNMFDSSKDNDKAVMICPGVAFDRKCNRVGYGGGYYDRYLSRTNVTTIALAYDFQMVGNVDVDEFDNKVDVIVTPENIFR